MTDLPPDPSETPPLPGYSSALLTLHARARSGSAPDLPLPGFRPLPTGEALRTLAESTEEEVPLSARLGVLGDLARAGFPEWETQGEAYRQLAASVAERRGVEADGILAGLRQSVTAGVPFATTPDGRRLPHHEAAFVAEDVCTVRRVEVGGVTATWIFSEFETDALFEDVVGWVDPRSWPERGRLLFKSMALVGGGEPLTLGPPGDPHWHGVFLEEVQLVQRVRTLLHCAYWQDGDRAAGMTYDLDMSLDGQIDVDRGFLLVNDVGPVRRVKALKIVGFTQDGWDDLSAHVCPFWTDWVRRAVEGGSSSSPVQPGEAPGPEVGSSQSPLVDTLDAWVAFLGDSARVYLELLQDMTTRVGTSGISAAACLNDDRRLFSQLAKDWAKAWAYGMDTVDEVAREGLDAGLTPPGTPRERGRGAATSMTAGASRTSGAAAASQTAAADTAPAEADTEGTTVPVPGLGPNDSPAVSDLVSIEAGGAVIPAGSIVATVQPLGGSRHGVRMRTSSASAAPGLYVGQLTVGQGAGANTVPVQLYVSRARRT